MNDLTETKHFFSLVNPKWVTGSVNLIISMCPLIVGVIVFAIWLFFSGRLYPASPFQGLDVVYSMLAGSIITISVATALYLVDLERLVEVAAKSGGHSNITRARYTIIGAIALLMIVFGYYILQTRLDKSDSCSLWALHKREWAHDIVTIVVFGAFLLADRLTIDAMREAKEVIVEKSLTGSEDISVSIDFASQQLWLIDVPVLVGAIISLAFAALMPHFNHWNPDLFNISGHWRAEIRAGRVSDLFDCKMKSLSLGEFESSVSEMFSAGIAMGYLAAHIIVSQLVFGILTFRYRSKRPHLLKVSLDLVEGARA